MLAMTGRWASKPRNLTAPKNIIHFRSRLRMKLQENISPNESDRRLPQGENKRQRCVLLAEDDRAVRRLLEVVLERAGYRVVLAADGLEAMKLVLAETVDVVITDAMMPNLSGHEFCRFIRNSPALSQLPIILLSALENKDTNQTGQKSEQADAFLAKPVSSESLIECIETLLAQQKD